MAEAEGAASDGVLAENASGSATADTDSGPVVSASAAQDPPIATADATGEQVPPLVVSDDPTAASSNASAAPSRRTKLALVAASLFVSLLLAEGAVRLSGIAHAGRGAPWFAGGNHPRFLFQPDDDSGYTLRPGFRGREIARGHEFDVPVAIDARGLRDHAHAAQPRPAVLAIGDSMTFGEGVTAEESWPAALERQLGARVYDAGVPGYGSPQMRGRLRRLLPALRPDLVIVALSPHWDQQRCAQPFIYKGGYIVAAGYADKVRLIDGNLYVADVKWPAIGTATAWAKRYSHLARLALPAVRAAAGAVARIGKPRVDPDAAGDVSATAATLVGMRGDAADVGVPLLVVFLDSRGPQYVADRDALAAALRRWNIDYVAVDDLIPEGEWKALRFTRDRHWNAAGHRRVGELIAPRVRELLARRIPASAAPEEAVAAAPGVPP